MTECCYNCNAALQEQDSICPRCGTRQLLQRGSRVYRLCGELGSGGFGRVYKAIDLSMYNRPCAIKEIVERSSTTRKDISSEVRVLARHAAPLSFMPDIYEYWYDRSHHYLVMQYIDGDTLSDLYKRPWHPSKVQNFVRELLLCLVDLHAAGVIHRDIKPANIKYSPSRGYVLLDFGLSTQEDVTGFEGGTPSFAPPEQLPRSRFAAHRNDPRSDLYSLGATAYYLLMNVLPATAHAREHGEELGDLRHRDGVPAGLKKVIEKMLALDPTQRPANARDALNTLDTPDLATMKFWLPPDDDASDPNAETELAVGADNPSPIPRNVPDNSPPLLPLPPASSSHSIDETTCDQQHYVSELARPNRGRITSLSVSPDGNHFAVSSACGLSIYDLATGNELDFHACPLPLLQVAYLRNGSLLAAANSASVDLFNMLERSFTVAERLPHETNQVCVTAAAASDLLAVGLEGETCLWHLSALAGKPVAELTRLREDGDCVSAFTPDGSVFVLASRTAVRVWRMVEAQLVLERELPLYSEPVGAVAISQRGDLVAFVAGRAVEVWQVAEQRMVGRFARYDNPILGVALSPDGQTLAFTSANTLIMQPLPAHRRHLVIERPARGISHVAFAATGERLIGCSSEEIWAWRVSDGSPLFARHDHLSGQHSLAFAASSQALAAVGRRVCLWPLVHNGLLPREYEHQGRSQNGVAMSADGQLLAVASDVGIKLWDVQHNSERGTIASPAGQSHSVVFTPAGTTLLHVANDSIERWNINNNSFQCTSLPSPLPMPYSVAFAADGSQLAIYNEQAIMVLTSDGTQIYRLDLEEEMLHVALATGAQTIAAASEQCVTIWQTAATAPRLLRIEQPRVRRVTLAHDGTLAALLLGHSIELWQVAGAQPLLITTLRGHTDIVNDCVFAPDGSRLASASQDGTVRLWRLQEP